MFLPPEVGQKPPELKTTVDAEGVVRLVWGPSAQTIGLTAELHRSSDKDFTPDENTLLARTPLFYYVDRDAPVGKQYYALVLLSTDGRSQPAHAAVDVPQPIAPPPPSDLTVVPASSAIRLRWQAPEASLLGYRVYRAKSGTEPLECITPQPVRQPAYVDTSVQTDVAYRYVVRSVSQRKATSEPTATAAGRPRTAGSTWRPATTARRRLSTKTENW